MTAEKKREFINKSAWFHRIDLGDGVITPGGQDTAATLGRIGIPADLSGKTVLDIGANDGFFSFECERRGATVTALDMWNRKYDGTRAIENIQFCKKVLGSNIEIVQADVLSYGHEPFDLVLFMGVLYHLQDMMAGLRKVAELTKPDGKAIIETHFVAGGDSPSARFYPGAELNNDPTNWWGPNAACVRMMAEIFFKRVRVVNTWCDRMTIHAEEPIA